MINNMSWFWRKILTNKLLKQYFKGKNYYLILNLKEKKISNPDQNIVKDCEDFCNNRASILVDFTIYFLKIVIAFLLMFLNGMHWTLYLATLMWPLIFIICYGIGIPFASQLLTFKKAMEGKYRYFHARIREYSESMAFLFF